MLGYIQSRSLFSCIKTFDFSTLYTTIPHSKLKYRLKDCIEQHINIFALKVRIVIFVHIFYY
jgi:hypothetical protein